MGLTFDNVDLESTFDLIIDGASSWPKPERDVELVHVPGRSGDLLFDNGCWHNVQITYNLLIKDDWKTKFENFAAWLCSKIGYFRLEDPDRHPGVYRMAEFSGPIEPELWFTTDTGVFELTFNCKPQQFLTSGEEPMRFIYCKEGGSWDVTLGNAGYLSTGALKLEEGQTIGIRAKASASGLQLKLEAGNLKVYKSGGTTYADPGDFIRNAYRTSSQAGQIVEITTTLTAADFVYDGDDYPYIGISFFNANLLTVFSDFQVGIDGDWYDVIVIPDGNNVWTASSIITNPTNYEADPLIQMWPGTTKINDYSVQYKDDIIAKPTAFIDCDLEDCYSESGGVISNVNSKVTITCSNAKELKDFPYFAPGANTFRKTHNSKIDWYAESGQIVIIPRWYRI